MQLVVNVVVFGGLGLMALLVGLELLQYLIGGIDK